MCNIGPIDRILRALVGLLLLLMVFIGPQNAWGWIGLIPLATAVMAHCPLYTLLGIEKSI